MTVRRSGAPVPPLGSYVAKRCPLRVQLDQVEPGVPLEPAPDVQLRLDDGIAFEAAIVDELREYAGSSWVFIDDRAPSAEQIEATVAAVTARAQVVVGARLPDDAARGRSGAPDLLVHDTSGYVPVDVKHHRTLDTGDDAVLTSTLAKPTPAAAVTIGNAALRTSKDDAMQLAHYRRMLEAHGCYSSTSLGGIIGKERHIVWYDLDTAMWTTPAKSGGKKRKRRTTMEVYDFEFAFRRDMAAEAIAGLPLLPPVRIADCATCGWRERCTPQLEAGTGDPSLLPRIGYRQWRILRDAGIADRAAVASLDHSTAVLAATVDLPKWMAAAADCNPHTPIDRLRPRARTQAQAICDAGISTAGELLAEVHSPTAALDGAGFVPDAILNARAALGPQPVYRRPGVVAPQIPRADIEIDIDMENVLDGVYMWGTQVTDRTGTDLVEPGYRAFATWDPLASETEYENFIRFWDWLSAQISHCTGAGASVLAYCWHEAAENTQLRRISRHSPVLHDRVDAFVTSGQWVDLERTFKAGWITGGSTGLKAIATLAGFHWDVNDADGGMSMVRYAEAAAGSTEARAWLTAYNRGDVEATLAIREWLTSSGETWPEVTTVLRT